MSKELQSNVSFSHFVEINPTFAEESLFVISAHAQPLFVPTQQGSFQHRWGEPLLPAGRGTIVMTRWHTLLLQSDSFQRPDDWIHTPLVAQAVSGVFLK